MKGFFHRRTPRMRRILLVESGSRNVSERWLANLETLEPSASVDLLTCFDGSINAPQIANTYTTSDHRTPAERAQLVEGLALNEYDAVAILCTAEPLMTKWKWYTAWKIPSKLLIVNENSDWFWFDRGHWSIIRRFVTYRAGLSGSGALTQPLKLLVFPFTLAYLLLYAGAVHLRRKLR